MRVQTEEWRRFIPGVRMYKGKMTYFYNGEKLWDDENEEHLVYDEKERQKWVVIMVLPGVEIIPRDSFLGCKNIKTVVMSESVKRIERFAFYGCYSLEFIRLSKRLIYIGNRAFGSCESLTSIFIPESCREIGDFAFEGCENLIILTVPRQTALGEYVIVETALLKASPFNKENNEAVNEWFKSLNQDEEFLALHRECASIEPSENNINEIIKEQGLPSLHVKNQIGVTALEYLRNNPYTDITEKKLIKRLVLDLMGEIITYFDKMISFY